MPARKDVYKRQNLHLEEGAELHFSGNINDYLPVVLTRFEGVEVYSLGALVYANNQENIALTGHGKLVAPTTDCEIWKRQCYESIEKYVEQYPDVKERIADGKKGRSVFLPLFVSPTNCKNVLIEGVTLERSLFWNIVPVYCDGVIIRCLLYTSRIGLRIQASFVSVTPENDAGVVNIPFNHFFYEFCTDFGVVTVLPACQFIHVDKPQ